MDKQVTIQNADTHILKSAAYDLMMEIEQKKQVLQTINQELASRAQKAQEKKKMYETTNDVVVEEVVETTEEATETAE
jgi:hypothetical protein